MFRWPQDLRSDIVYGARGLRRTPWLTLAVVLTFAAGIGANTAIFSVVNGWLLRPLPVPNPEQVVVLASVEEGRRDALISFANFNDLRAQSTESFSGLYAFAFRIAGLTANGTTRQFVMGAVSGEYFSGLGVPAAHGRVFNPGEGESAGEAVSVVLSHRYWQNHFSGDLSVIGKSVAVNGTQATVIGIAPETFQGTLFGFPLDGYATLSAIARSSNWHDRTNRSLNVLGRRKPGVTLAQAQASTDLIARRLAEQFPESNRGVRFRVIPESNARPVPMVANFVPVIAGLFLFLPALVLMMSCLNVAGIMLARAEARSRELAIRSSLGGGRGRLIRQLLTETLMLSTAGAIAGIVLGRWCVDFAGEHVQRMFSSASNYRVSMDASIDTRVFAYSLACAFAAALFAGLWPGLRASRVDLRSLLQSGGAASSTPGRRRMYKTLVVAQLAASVVLLIVSALFIRSLNEASQIDFGFDKNNVAAVFVDPGQLGYDSTRTHALYKDLRDRFAALPGVESAGVAQSLPLTFLGAAGSVYVDGVEPSNPASYNLIDENYLATMRTPILSGRGIEKSDTNVAVINETMAQRLWPNQSPLGKRFSLQRSGGQLIEVIGVAKNGQYKFFTAEPQPFFYMPLTEASPSARTFVVRTRSSAESMMPAIRAAVQSHSPELLISSLMTLEQITRGPAGLFLLQLAAVLSGLIGALGLGLAIVGTYGVVAYGVSQRQREFGIRIALGAERRVITKLVIAEGARMAAIGLALGIVTALLAKRGLERLLIGVSGADPLTYAAVSIALLAVVIAASYFPARAASVVNPVDSLRRE